MGHLRALSCSILMTVLWTATSAASGITTLLSFHDVLLHPGEDVIFSAYFHNETENIAEIEIPYQVQIVVERPEQLPVQLSAFSLAEEDKTVTLQPAGFYRQQFSTTIPPDLFGTFQYSIAGYPAIKGLLAITPAPKKENMVAADSTPAPQTPEKGSGPDCIDKLEPQETPDRYPMMTNLEPLYQSSMANFAIHEPIYFLVGADPGKSKFQLSFKYRLFDPSGSLSRKYEWLGGIHLAYTQTSFWDLSSDSAPFEDTSYKPELLFLSENIANRPSWMDGLFFQTGVRHESNGQAGSESRSTNTFYVQPLSMFFFQESLLGFSIAPKAWVYFNTEDDTTGDLANYRGYFEIESRFGKANNLMLSTNLRFAAEGTSFEANLTYPIHRFLGNNLDLYLYVQYANALAESLIDYRERTEALRIGLSLVR